MNKAAAIIILVFLVIAGIVAYEVIHSRTVPASEGYSLQEGDQASQQTQPVSQSDDSQQSSAQQPAAPQPSVATNAVTYTPPTDAEIKAVKDQKTMNATITTSLGVIQVELYGDKTPATVANFVKLADAGFYNSIKFHRVIKGFMIQGGDPLTKDDAMQARWGSGGPGYQFADEPFTGTYTRGTLAMANSGPNTNGSQFFIMHQDYDLQPNYVIFGKATAGLDVVDKIANLQTDPSNDRPQTSPVIQNITIDK
jgi:cyclophilin family peptidyl-prolyl cis-trans isomerase